MYLFTLFTVTLLISNAVVSHGYEYAKCCKIGDFLKKINSTYQCVKDRTKRLQILTNSTDFLGANSTGECTDVSTNFYIFNVSDTHIIETSLAKDDVFPKCCPLQYVYNTVLHSCEEKENASHYYIKEKNIKVGLTNCRVIVDYELNATVDFENSLLNASNQILQEISPIYSGSYCIDENERGSFVMRKCNEDLDICDEMKCIKKCCPDGQSFINGSHCFDTYTHGLNLSVLSHLIEKSQESFAVIHNRTCPKIYLMNEQKYAFNLDERGVFKYWKNNTESYEYDDVEDMESYCIEYAEKASTRGYFFFMCFPQKIIKQKFLYTVWPKMLSCIFLLLTIIIYFMLNETRKMFGKILVNYCLAMLIEFAILTYAHVHLQPSVTDCKLRAFTIIFFATATFTWSNVMCCDIWSTFGTTKRTVGSNQRKRDLRKLLLYCCYGWGIPLILTLIIYLCYNYQGLPYSIQPFMAERKCFFDKHKGNYAQALFMNFPLLIMQIANLLLFIKTVTYCLRVKAEINKINDTTADDKTKKFQRDKERLFLVMKLLIIMGISFVFEVISAFFDMSALGEFPKYIEIIWDCFNALQGVFIFVIFICKKKVFLDLLQKLRLRQITYASTSSIRTQSTTTSNGVPMFAFGNKNGKT